MKDTDFLHSNRNIFGIHPKKVNDLYVLTLLQSFCNSGIMSTRALSKKHVTDQLSGDYLFVYVCFYKLLANFQTF